MLWFATKFFFVASKTTPLKKANRNLNGNPSLRSVWQHDPRWKSSPVSSFPVENCCLPKAYLKRWIGLSTFGAREICVVIWKKELLKKECVRMWRKGEKFNWCIGYRKLSSLTVCLKRFMHEKY